VLLNYSLKENVNELKKRIIVFFWPNCFTNGKKAALDEMIY
jgi:hypothetical protein